ncbi:hypothetical protein CUMW_005660 [Citrus unshiu]|nr:hypothetical protein CUMW_005660 [Citrus unshiu]
MDYRRKVAGSPPDHRRTTGPPPDHRTSARLPAPATGPPFYFIYIYIFFITNINNLIFKLSYTVQFTPSRARGSGYTFGSLNWRDGQHVVRSPIAVAV